MLRFPTYIKSTIEGETVTLYNLKNNHFIKFQKKSLDFLNEFMEENGEESLGTLNEDKYKKFVIFLKYLKDKKYIIEETTEDTKENLKQEFLKEKRGAYYEVTNRCNLKCNFCYANSDFVAGQIDGDFELSKKILDSAAQLNIINLAISGGEPLLRKDIFKIIEHAKKRMTKVTLVTNGVLIDKKIAIKLKETNLDNISISLESSRKEIHDSLRGQGTFEKILKTIHWLKDAGFDKKSLNICATFNRKNIQSLHEFPKFAEDLDVNMSLSSFQPIGRGKISDEFAITKEQFFRFILQLKEKHMRDMIKYLEEKGTELSNQNNESKIVLFIKNKCGIVKKSLGIKFNGDLVPCHLFFSVNDPKIIIGNILEKSISDRLWDFYLKIPTVDEKESCKGCNVRYFCGGSCYASGYARDGSFATPHPFCERFKILYTAINRSLGDNNELVSLRRNISEYLNLQLN